MLIMSIGKLVNLLENRKVEQKTNKLLILSVELILLYTSQHKGKNLLMKCLSRKVNTTRKIIFFPKTVLGAVYLADVDTRKLGYNWLV